MYELGRQNALITRDFAGSLDSIEDPDFVVENCLALRQSELEEGPFRR